MGLFVNKKQEEVDKFMESIALTRSDSENQWSFQLFQERERILGGHLIAQMDKPEDIQEGFLFKNKCLPGGWTQDWFFLNLTLNLAREYVLLRNNMIEINDPENVVYQGYRENMCEKFFGKSTNELETRLGGFSELQDLIFDAVVHPDNSVSFGIMCLLPNKVSNIEKYRDVKLSAFGEYLRRKYGIQSEF